METEAASVGESLDGYTSATELLPDAVAWGDALGARAGSSPRGEDAEELWGWIQDRLAAAAERGVDLPFERLRGQHGLDDDEQAVVLTLLGPELDAALQERGPCPAGPSCTVGCLLRLLGPALHDQERVRACLSAERTLRRERLVQLSPPEVGGEEIAFLQRRIRLASRVVDFLRGHDDLDESLAGWCRYVVPRATFDELLLPRRVLKLVRQTLSRSRPGQAAPPVLLLGPAGVGKRMLAACVAGQLGHRLLVAEFEGLLGHALPPGELLARVQRDAELSGATLYLRGGEQLPGTLSDLSAVSLAQQLQGSRGPMFLGLRQIPAWLEAVLPPMVRIRLPMPAPAAREELWRRAIGTSTRLGAEVDLTELSHRFVLSGGAIRRASAVALQRARMRSSRVSLSQDDLAHGAAQQLAGGQQSLGRRIVPRATWDDLILPDDELERLQEVVAFARSLRPAVERWGLPPDLATERGLGALFAGPPGTGKTLAAGLVAKELKLPLLRVEASRLRARAEEATERNLARAFAEATESPAVLLLSSVDELLRGPASARGRGQGPSESLVQQLLHHIEDLPGLTLLTTSAEESLGEALQRRIDFQVAFPFPDQADRELLWQRMFPDDSRLADDVNWTALALSFEMSGGHIRNAALRAAVLATDAEQDEIDQNALWEAGRQEYVRMGKLVRG